MRGLSRRTALPSRESEERSRDRRGKRRLGPRRDPGPQTPIDASGAHPFTIDDDRRGLHSGEPAPARIAPLQEPARKVPEEKGSMVQEVVRDHGQPNEG